MLLGPQLYVFLNYPDRKVAIIPISRDYNTANAPGWAKAMIAGLDRCINKADNIIDSDHSDKG